MRHATLVVVLGLCLAACDVPRPPDSDATGDASADGQATCEPGSALTPFFVQVSFLSEDEPSGLGLFATGDCQVTYNGPASGARLAAGCEQELRLQCASDARPVVVGVTLPRDLAGLEAQVGETLSVVVARVDYVPSGDGTYVALRDLTGALRAFLVRGPSGQPFTELGATCPFGFQCPSATFAAADCAPVAEECGQRVWPPLELRPVAESAPVTLRQGELTSLASGSSTWAFFVSYASHLVDDETSCLDAPTASLAAAIVKQP